MQYKTLTITSPEFDLCREIRARVFIEEQGVPETREQDELDITSVHYLFSDTNEQGDIHFGTARSRIEKDYSKIERFAFLPEYRGKGMAGDAFMAVVRDCLERFPQTPVVINAQAYLEPFYQNLGFVPEGDLFVDAGIMHRRMIFRD